MLVPFQTFFVFTSLPLVLGTALRTHLSTRVLHNQRDSAPHGWSLQRRAHPALSIPLSIALRQSNVDKLDQYLLDVAEPESPDYGKHWTPTQVIETFRPSTDTIDTVRSWLVDDGIHPSRIQLSHDGGYLHLNVSVAEAESLLATQYYVYQHEESGDEHVGCHQGYHLPEHVSAHVDLVSPTIQSSGTKTFLQHGKRDGVAHIPGSLSKRDGLVKGTVYTDASHCDKQITLKCLKEMYDFDYNPVAYQGNSVGIVELGHQVYNAADLDEFFHRFVPDMVGARPAYHSVDGAMINNSQTTSNGEANLDFQLMMGLLGRHQVVTLYQIGGKANFNTMLEGLDDEYCKSQRGDFCGHAYRPNVISISYSSPETGDFDAIRRECTEFGKLSLLGTTFLASSGDQGVQQGQSCLANNGTIVKKHGNFIVGWPALCPYITAVGATELPAGRKVHDRERATSTFASGGGFSNVFARPKWQDRAVKNYLKKHAPSYGAHVFNRTGRGLPDISANGHNTLVVNGGKVDTSGGTSASAPIVGAMITAVNDARIAAGKSPVGWINPAIYSHRFAGVFNDIVEGSNPGCGTDGFPAAVGWDPVTGLGTPRFKRMLERFMMLP